MQQAAAFTPQYNEPVIFMPGVFNETLELLFDSHQYFEFYGEEEQLRLPEYYRMAYTSEMSRITMRLTSIMAWVMVRKAVHTGKLEAGLASEKYRLDGEEICRSDISPEINNLPFYIGELAHKSRNLYERVWRLDQLTHQTQEM